LRETFGLDPTIEDLRRLPRLEMAEKLGGRIREYYDAKQARVGAERMLLYERLIMLQIVDAQWKDHLYALDHLKEGIGLRGYGQRDPLVEYKKESFELFRDLNNRIDEEILKWIFLYQPVPVDEEAETAAVEAAATRRRGMPRNLTFNDPSEASGAFARAEPREARGGGDTVQTVKREGRKVGRNEPCPCGSGKKYKRCHGA
jgi:preprotein translocase subunit SecA